jgi:thioredoxin reductase (NADPH)
MGKMVKPVILTVDDEKLVLAAIERDLRAHFRSEYTIIKASSGQEALEAVKKLKQRETPVALFLVDQRMPNMTGIEFLMEARKIYPEARKVLLTAYADTQAAISSINEVGLDFYLMKPWHPPEDNLYPVLDDLLDVWQKQVDLPYDGIRVAGTLWSPRSHEIKDFLARNQIPYQWVDIEVDETIRGVVDEINQGKHRLPVVFFNDGTYLVEPTTREVAEKTGMQTKATQPFYDLAIIGAGPAGLAAAVYGASEGLRTLLIEKEAPGGQAGTSSRIENYLGFPNGVSGGHLAQRAVFQARRFGVEILSAEEVTGLRAEDSYRFIRLAGGDEISCHSILVSTGVSVRRLQAPGVEELTGAGVYYGAALTEAVNYKGKDIMVVGGGNSAGQAAVFFARYARQVTILILSSSLEFGMSSYLVEQIRNIPNIDVRPHSEVVEAVGEKKLEQVCVKDRETGVIHALTAAAMYIFIGMVPHTEMVGDLVERDSAGFIMTGLDLLKNGARPKGWKLKRDPFILETSCPGIFAAGDVRHGSIKRVATAVGEGSMTVALVHQYLKTV